jgi:hypothetical protein
MLWEIYQLPDHNTDNTILLDDLCMNLRSQPKNCIRIKKFLGLSFNDLIKVFQDKFATLLLSEISKQIKKGGAVPASSASPAEEKKTKSKRGGKSQQQSTEAASAHHSEVEMIEQEELQI